MALPRTKLGGWVSGIGCVVVLLALLTASLAWRLFWQGGVALGPLQLETHAIQASNCTASTSIGFEQGKGAGIDCRYVLVVDETASPLGTVVAAELAAELRKTRGVERVDVGRAAFQRGQRLPGLTVTLRLDRIEEHDGLVQRHLQARLLVNLHSGAAYGPGGYSDGSLGPRFDVNWCGKLEHESDSRGDGIGASRYRVTGQDMGQQLGQTLRKAIDEWVAKQGLAPALPAGACGPFRESDDRPLFRELGALELIAGTTPWTHQESAWRWTDARPPRAVIDSLAEKLRKEGWQVVSKFPSSPHDPPIGKAFVWLRKGDRLLHAFEDCPFADLNSEQSHPAADKKPEASRAYVLHYFDQFSPAERQSLIAGLLDKPDGLREAGRFLNLMSMPQMQQYYARLEAANPSSVDDWLLLAEHHGTRDKLQAAACLRRAVLWSTLDDRDLALQSRIEELAKKLGDKQLASHAPDGRELAALGIPPLEHPVAKTVAVDEPVAAWRECSGRLYFARAYVHTVGGDDFEIRYRVGGKTGSSSGSQGGFHADGIWRASTVTGFNELHVRIQARQLAPNRFHLQLERSP